MWTIRESCGEITGKSINASKSIKPLLAKIWPQCIVLLETMAPHNINLTLPYLISLTVHNPTLTNIIQHIFCNEQIFFMSGWAQNGWGRRRDGREHVSWHVPGQPRLPAASRRWVQPVPHAWQPATTWCPSHLRASAVKPGRHASADAK